MKKIAEYRKLLEVDHKVTLKELKNIYRNVMKDTHPDKFINDEENVFRLNHYISAESRVVINVAHRSFPLSVEI